MIEPRTVRHSPSAENAPCGLLTTDAKGNLLEVNSLFCSWVGRSREELIGASRLQDRLSIGSRMFMQTHWMPLMQMQGSIAEVKVEVVRADGSTMPVVMNAVSRHLEGAVVHDVAMFIARDRDRYEKELLKAQKGLLELVDKEKQLLAAAQDRALFAEQMVGIVSHDLRNPLSAVQLGAAALARSAPTVQQQRILDRISRSTNRAHRLIADLLDFTLARLGPGLAISSRPLDPHLAVADAVEELAAIYPQRAVRHVRFGSGLGAGDADRLLQLVGNLVSNANTYGETGKPITVTSTVEGPSYTIEVHNYGTPISADALGELFKPMVRGDTAAGEATSVGLGLFIVDSIAKAHGGSMSVTSSQEQGTTFRAVFPGEEPTAQMGHR